VARPVFEAPRLSERHTITSAESAPALDSILISLLSPMCCGGGKDKTVTREVCRTRPCAETRPMGRQAICGTHLFDFDPQLPLVDGTRCLLKHRDPYIQRGKTKSQYDDRLYHLVDLVLPASGRQNIGNLFEGFLPPLVPSKHQHPSLAGSPIYLCRRMDSISIHGLECIQYGLLIVRD